MNHTLRSVVEEELQKAYERGVEDGMKREHAMWQLTAIGQEIERVQAINISSERVHKTEKNEHEWVGLTDEEYEEMAEQYVTNCYFDTLEYAKNIESKLKDKNNG